jgi:hypothetical protein
MRSQRSPSSRETPLQLWRDSVEAILSKLDQPSQLRKRLISTTLTSLLLESLSVSTHPTLEEDVLMTTQITMSTTQSQTATLQNVDVLQNTEATTQKKRIATPQEPTPQDEVVTNRTIATKEAVKITMVNQINITIQIAKDPQVVIERIEDIKTVAGVKLKLLKIASQLMRLLET